MQENTYAAVGITGAAIGQKITLRAGVTQIQAATLSGNTACLELIMKPISPTVLANNITVQISPSGLIKVPSGSLSAYKAAPPWSGLSSQIVAI